MAQNFLKRFIVSLADTYRQEDVPADVAKASPAMSFNSMPGNLLSMPTAGMNTKKFGSGVSFEVLRNFSVVYDVARACINHRKRQISNLEWNIVPRDQKEVNDTQVDAVKLFFKKPYPATNFRTFVDKILEDMLVFDGIVLWKDVTFGGQIEGLLNVDASTIRIKVAEDGTLPLPPEAAYVQMINGQVHEKYTLDEMYYRIMNPRTNTPYGLSPLESLIIGVDSALRSQLYNLSLLSDGNVPEGFFTLPKDWDSDNIKEFQTWFDAMLAGNPMKVTRLKFMPDGKYFPTKKPADMQFIEFEKWLLMKTCAMFDVQPSDIGFTDMVNKSTSDSQQELGMERGLVPTALFLKELFDEIIEQDFGLVDLQFEWVGLQATDVDFELKRNESMLKNGAMTIDEWRTQQGMEPFNLESTQNPMIHTGNGPVMLEGITMEAEEQKRENAKQIANARANPKPKEDDKDDDDDDDDSAKAELSEFGS